MDLSDPGYVGSPSDRAKVRELKVEAALNSGTVEQRLEKIAAVLARMDGVHNSGDMVRVAEEVERLVHYERLEADPR